MALDPTPDEALDTTPDEAMATTPGSKPLWISYGGQGQAALWAPRLNAPLLNASYEAGPARKPMI